MVPSSDMQKNKKIVRESISRVTGYRQALPPQQKENRPASSRLKPCGQSAVCLKNRQLLSLGSSCQIVTAFYFGGRSTVGLWVKLSLCQMF
jgi:hypothetical protein